MQALIAKKLHASLQLVDELQKDAEQKSGFVSLVAETLLKFQDSISLVISRVEAHKDCTISPLHKYLGSGDSTGGVSSGLLKSLLTKKYLSLFEELMERQKAEDPSKQYLKKIDHLAHWQKLADF